jgi:hypothetical protein
LVFSWSGPPPASISASPPFANGALEAAGFDIIRPWNKPP